MGDQVGEDRDYLANEINTIETDVRTSIETFIKCTTTVTETFDANFEKFKTAVKVSS
jgi:hypothetical protein